PAGSTAAVAPASSCRFRALLPSAGCGLPPRRSGGRAPERRDLACPPDPPPPPIGGIAVGPPEAAAGPPPSPPRRRSAGSPPRRSEDRPRAPPRVPALGARSAVAALPDGLLRPLRVPRGSRG